MGETGVVVEVNLATGSGSPIFCEPLLNEHPDVLGDLRPEEEEEFMREMADILEYLDKSEFYGNSGNGEA